MSHTLFAKGLRVVSHRVLSPEYDMDAYMTTLVGGEALGLVLKFGSSQKYRTKSQHKSHKYFTSNNHDPPLMIIIHVLLVSRGSKVGTFPPS